MTRLRPLLAPALLAMILFSGCLVATPGPEYGGGGYYDVPPPMPAVVELDNGPYFYQGGFTYVYRDNAWYYSHHRRGPWRTLPRDHYPREIRRGDHRVWSRGGEHEEHEHR